MLAPLTSEAKPSSHFLSKLIFQDLNDSSSKGFCVEEAPWGAVGLSDGDFPPVQAVASKRNKKNQ